MDDRIFRPRSPVSLHSTANANEQDIVYPIHMYQKKSAMSRVYGAFSIHSGRRLLITAIRGWDRRQLRSWPFNCLDAIGNATVASKPLVRGKAPPYTTLRRHVCHDCTSVTPWSYKRSLKCLYTAVSLVRYHLTICLLHPLCITTYSELQNPAPSLRRLHLLNDLLSLLMIKSKLFVPIRWAV